MHKSIKPILVGVAIFLSLAGAGAWYFSSAINPAQLTKLLASTVKDATGRDLTISGPVNLKLFPSIGVTAEQVAFSNTSWASNKDMLIIKHIDMTVKLLPLIKGSVEIKSVKLDGLEAYLQTNAVGDGNWSMSDVATIISAPTISVPAISSPSKDGPASPSSESNAFIAIDSFEVSDARISYQDGNNLPTIFALPKVMFDKNGSSTDVFLQAVYGKSKLEIKGKVGMLRQAVVDWNIKPVKMNIGLVATLDGKALDIKGVINKDPQALPQFDIALDSKSFNFISLAGSAALAAGGDSKQSSVKHEQSKYFFSDEALPFTMLPEANGKISLNIAELVIPHQAPLVNFKADALFKKQHIEINDLSFSLGKGNAQGQVVIDQYHSANPSVKVKWMAQGFTWQQMIGSSDASSKVSGGDVQIAMNVMGTGKSLHQLVSRANGATQISVGPATMGTQYLNEGGDVVISILNAINPMQKKSSQTILSCAVAYLPINNGIVNIDNSIGIETDRLNIVGNGSVNLATEAINLSIDPKEKSGLTTGLDLGGLVKLQGTLQNPKTVLNQAGVVNSAVSIGLGILTAGVSIAAENAREMITKTQPCKTALHPWSDIYPGTTK